MFFIDGSGAATGGRGGMVSISVGSGGASGRAVLERALRPQHGAQRRRAGVWRAARARRRAAA